MASRNSQPRRIVFLRAPENSRIRVVAGAEPWRTLPLNTRRELYRIGEESGWTRKQVRAAYEANQPIGGTRYYQQRARAVTSGRLIPVRQGRSYSEYSQRSQRTIDRRARLYGLTEDEKRQGLRQGWRPFSHSSAERVPATVRARLANQGYDNSQDSPAVRDKRNRAIEEAFAFANRENAEGNLKANGQAIAARLNVATEPQLDMWLAADDAAKKELASAQYTPEIDEPTLPAAQYVNPDTGQVEYQHPITGKRTTEAYIHDNVFWYH